MGYKFWPDFSICCRGKRGTGNCRERGKQVNALEPWKEPCTVTYCSGIFKLGSRDALNLRQQATAIFFHPDTQYISIT